MRKLTLIPVLLMLVCSIAMAEETPEPDTPPLNLKLHKDMIVNTPDQPNHHATKHPGGTATAHKTKHGHAVVKSFNHGSSTDEEMRNSHQKNLVNKSF